MSLMNDALRKKGRELNPLTGRIGAFRKKTEGARRGKWRRIGGFFIAFLAVVAAGSALHFFLFRTVPPPMTPVAMLIVPPEPEVTVEKTAKDEGAPGTEAKSGLAPEDENQTPDSGNKAPEVRQRIVPPAAAIQPGRKEPESVFAAEVPAALSLTEGLVRNDNPKPEALPDAEKDRAVPVEKESGPNRPAKVSVPESQPPKKTVEAVVDPAERFYQKAASYHRQNRLQAAIELYLSVLKENPGHTAARFNLAAAYLQSDAFPEAFRLLETLREDDPENPDIPLNMAISKIGSGDLQEALMLLNAAEEKHAPAFELSFHRGVIFSRGQQLEEALRWYRRAEAINPRHDRLVFNLALTHDKLQRHEAALRYYLLFLDQAISSLPGEKEAVADRVRVLKAYLGRRQAELAGKISMEQR